MNNQRNVRGQAAELLPELKAKTGPQYGRLEEQQSRSYYQNHGRASERQSHRSRLPLRALCPGPWQEAGAVEPLPRSGRPSG